MTYMNANAPRLSVGEVITKPNGYDFSILHRGKPAMTFMFTSAAETKKAQKLMQKAIENPKLQHAIRNGTIISGI